MPSGVQATKPGILVERVRERADRTAFGGDEGEPGVVGEIFRLLPMDEEKRICFPSGDHWGERVRPGLGDDLFHRIVGQVEDIDVGRPALDEVRIDGRAERDFRPVGRPGEGADREILALSSAAGPAWGAFIASATSNVQMWVWVYSFRTTS